jgi:hypothetical protein
VDTQHEGDPRAGPLSQNETVFMKRFGGVVHHTKNKIFD